jgi:hypothetical protein
MLAMACCFLMSAGGQGALAQSPELRTLSNQFKTEAGCPVQVVSAKTDLEIDPIGTPVACRIYIDYKNVSTRTVTGVKFRIGYIDGEEKIRGFFHAPDGHVLEPGAQSSARWRGDKVDPRTSRVMLRVLVARFSDGSVWESEKMKELAPGTGGPNSGTGGSVSPGPAGGAAEPAAAVPAGSIKPAGAAAETGSVAGEIPDAPSSSSLPPVGSPGPVTPAVEGSPASMPAGSDKSSDGY